MKPPRILTCEKRTRAERFPANTRGSILDWDIYPCGNHVHVDLLVPGLKRPVQFAIEADGAYDLMAELGRAFDAAVGI